MFCHCLLRLLRQHLFDPEKGELLQTERKISLKSRLKFNSLFRRFSFANLIPTWTGVIFWKFKLSIVSNTAFERPKVFHSDFIFYFNFSFPLFQGSCTFWSFTIYFYFHVVLFWLVTSHVTVKGAKIQTELGFFNLPNSDIIIVHLLYPLVKETKKKIWTGKQ